MRVYLMRFDSDEALNRAFGLVMDAGKVQSSLVGPEPRQLRFMAQRPDAEPLVQRIYLEGGLTWCTAHRADAGVPSPAQSG